MILKHSGESYECDVAVRCANDRYIKLFKNGVEIAAFYNITNLTDYTITGGTFSAPCECDNPVRLNAYVIGGVTIEPPGWDESAEEFSYKIENPLFSGNTSTCNVLLIFETPPTFQYTATQGDGYIKIHTKSAPLTDVVIKSIQIHRAS